MYDPRRAVAGLEAELEFPILVPVERDVGVGSWTGLEEELFDLGGTLGSELEDGGGVVEVDTGDLYVVGEGGNGIVGVRRVAVYYTTLGPVAVTVWGGVLGGGEGGLRVSVPCLFSSLVNPPLSPPLFTPP